MDFCSIFQRIKLLGKLNQNERVYAGDVHVFNCSYSSYPNPSNKDIVWTFANFNRSREVTFHGDDSLAYHDKVRDLKTTLIQFPRSRTEPEVFENARKKALFRQKSCQSPSNTGKCMSFRKLCRNFPAFLGAVVVYRFMTIMLYDGTLSIVRPGYVWVTKTSISSVRSGYRPLR